MQSGTKEVLEEAAAVVVVEVSGVTETEALTITIRVPAVQVQQLPLQGRDTQVPDTLTFLMVMSPNSALCIISGGEEVTFVHLQPLVRGRMCTKPDLNNETGTSPV